MWLFGISFLKEVRLKIKIGIWIIRIMKQTQTVVKVGKVNRIASTAMRLFIL